MASKLRKTADRPLQSPRVILCEGADEYDILSWIRSQRGLGDESVELIDAKGRTRLLTELDSLRLQSGGSDIKLVAVVLDAEARSAADLALPQALREAATQAGLEFMAFQLPDADSPGALETLVRRHADSTAPAVTCSDAWEACLTSAVDDRTQAQKDKAWGHVWLAGQGAFHSRLGHALRYDANVRGLLPAVIQHFENLLDQVLNTPLK